MKNSLITTIFALLFFSGCGVSTKKIDDFTDRSIVYGWVNLTETSINNVSGTTLRESMPTDDRPYYSIAAKKLGEGYVLYHYGIAKGAYKLYSITGKKCVAFLCGRTIYNYKLGVQGAEIATTVVDKPGVYYLGSYSIKDLETGWFEPGKFSIEHAEDRPSRKEMLEFLLEGPPEEGEPLLTKRIQEALSRL